MELVMKGRNALVTGASLGIGFAISQKFALAGANVAMVARRAETLEASRREIQQKASTKIIGIAGDVSKAEDCNRAFEAAVKALGSVDVIVNNAGTSQTGKFESITDEVWQADIDLKLFAAIRLIRLAFPGMRERRFGRIINILNIGAKAPEGGRAPTAVTRAAGMALTKVLAGEGAPHNILVNALLVGRIESDQWVQRHAREGKNTSLDGYYAEMGKQIPLGRIGTADEFAGMALFLASDAGSYITGTAINIDGGLCPVV
jgi:NAD(P)-dependent dehydrogenase (short-subunit alcohol dehydrogenase family)